MLTITDKAGLFLLKMLEHIDAPRHVAIRLVSNKSSQVKLALDRPGNKDKRFYHADRIVLIVDPQIAVAMKNRRIDARPSDEGDQLIVRMAELEPTQNTV